MKKYISPEIEKIMMLTSDIVTVSSRGDINDIDDSTLPGADESALFPV